MLVIRLVTEEGLRQRVLPGSQGLTLVWALRGKLVVGSQTGVRACGGHPPA